jgi:DNA-binding transcriptional regulator YiaG
MSPRRIRQIRRTLGFSRRDFARTLWAASKTVMEWESGKRSPVGMHHRLLALWEQGLVNSSFRTALQDPRASDPMFLLFRLLRPLYWNRSANDIPAAEKTVAPLSSSSTKNSLAAKHLTPGRIQAIRNSLGFSQGDFAHFLWITYSTLNRWEHGHAPPFGMHLRILSLLEQNLRTPAFQATLRSPRSADHLFLLHQLLEYSFGDRPILKSKRRRT